MMPILILLTSKGILSRGEQCVMTYDMNHHQFGNSKHVLMTNKCIFRNGVLLETRNVNVPVSKAHWTNLCSLNLL